MQKVSITINDRGLNPVLVYLPGIHGDTTLITSFREQVRSRLCLLEVAYPYATEWSLEQYADSVEEALVSNGINKCWLLAESFGSQVAWKLMGKKRGFDVQGIILAGGFVRHPFILGVRIVRFFTRRLSLGAIKAFLKCYVFLCRIFVRKKPSNIRPIEDFSSKRASIIDRDSIVARYTLIIENDHREIARTVRCPVYYLTGYWDVIVPWVPVYQWLKKNCPGFKEKRVILRADHPVLAVAPEQSAEIILNWLESSASKTKLD